MKEYIVREYIQEEDRSFVRHTCEKKKEAIEWADYYGGTTEVWERDMSTMEEALIYISEIGENHEN